MNVLTYNRFCVFHCIGFFHSSQFCALETFKTNIYLCGRYWKCIFTLPLACQLSWISILRSISIHSALNGWKFMSTKFVSQCISNDLMNKMFMCGTNFWRKWWEKTLSGAIWIFGINLMNSSFLVCSMHILYIICCIILNFECKKTTLQTVKNVLVKNYPF